MHQEEESWIASSQALLAMTVDPNRRKRGEHLQR
jgi:hypothetical protein